MPDAILFSVGGSRTVVYFVLLPSSLIEYMSAGPCAYRSPG